MKWIVTLWNKFWLLDQEVVVSVDDALGDLKTSLDNLNIVKTLKADEAAFHAEAAKVSAAAQADAQAEADRAERIHTNISALIS